MERNFSQDALLTTEQVAKLFQLDHTTLVHWRTQNKGPSYLKLAGSGKKAPVRYRRSDVRAWLKSQEVKTS